MEESKQKKHNFKNKIFIFSFVVSIILIFIMFGEKQSIKWELITYRSIPHIDLSYVLVNSSDGGLYQGYIKGFVMFDNEGDQPKNMSQYYIIEPLQKVDENMNQVFSIEQIISLCPLAPTSIEKIEAVIKINTNNILTLEDKNGNEFLIDKTLKKVTMKDAGGDSVKLVTNNLEYTNFMREFLKKQY